MHPFELKFNAHHRYCTQYVAAYNGYFVQQKSRRKPILAATHRVNTHTGVYQLMHFPMVLYAKSLK